MVGAFAVLVLGAVLVADWGNTWAMSLKGKMIFQCLAGLLMFLCTVLGVSLTADCLSEERREGTLGLLFLTPLTGLDILLGKLVSSAVGSFYSILGVLPVLSVPLLFGGVTFGELFRLSLVLFNTLFLSLAVGLFVSSMAEDARKAHTNGLALMLFLMMIAPFLWWVLILYQIPGVTMEEVWLGLAVSPIFALIESGVFPAVTGFHSEQFVVSLLMVHAIGWGLILAAARLLPYTFKRSEEKAAKQARRKRRRAAKAALWRQEPRGVVARRRALEREPYSWMMMFRNQWERFLVELFCIIMLMLCGLYLSADFAMEATFFLYFTAIFLKLWLLVEVTTQIAGERKAGAFELLLVSPLGIEGIVRGINRALIWQFGRASCFLMVVGVLFVVTADQWNLEFAAGVRIFFWLAAVVFFLDLWALKWAGMWSAMWCRTAGRALGPPILTILILPWLLTFLTVVAVVFLDEARILELSNFFMRHWLFPGLWLAYSGWAVLSHGLWARYQVLYRARVLAMHGFDYRSAKREWLFAG